MLALPFLASFRQPSFPVSFALSASRWVRFVPIIYEFDFEGPALVTTGQLIEFVEGLMNKLDADLIDLAKLATSSDEVPLMLRELEGSEEAALLSNRWSARFPAASQKEAPLR